MEKPSEIKHERRKTTVLHCSDLHFGRGFQQTQADALIEQIRKLQPDGVVVSGDLTMRARHDQFSDAREYLRKIKEPLLLIPGNHDIPLYNLFARAIDPFGNYHKYTKGLGQNPMVLHDVAILGINTINPLRHQKGRVRPGDLAEAVKWLDASKKFHWRIVAVHQHLANLPTMPRPGTMKRGREFAAAMAEHGAHAVLCGHTHYNHAATSVDFFGAVHKPVILVQAGTATCARVRGNWKGEPRNTFNMLEFASDEMSVVRYDWSTQEKDFVRGEATGFPRTLFTGAA